MEELRKNPTLEYWEKVSAAIGYAVYNREVDTDFASVFKRADSEMYKNKKKHESHPPGLILSPTGSNIFIHIQSDSSFALILQKVLHCFHGTDKKNKRNQNT